jgi:hypothetical protein
MEMKDDGIKTWDALERWEAGTLEVEALEELNRALDSEGARRRVLDQWLIDRALPQALAKATIRDTHQQETAPQGGPANVVRVSLWRSSAWRTLGAAAAGLVLGAFGASLVSAKVGIGSKRITPVLEESFESGENPQSTGVPTTPGIWSGDFGAAVVEQSGIQPRSGQRMFQFLKADYEGKPPQFSYTGDLYRIIDLQGQDLGSGDSETLVVAEGSIRSIPFQEKGRFRASLWLYALEKLPALKGDDAVWPSRILRRPGAGNASRASAHRDLVLSNAGKEWEKLRVEMRVPPGTRSLMLSVHVADVLEGRNSKREGAVEFPGQFLDDVRISLVREVPRK